MAIQVEPAFIRWRLHLKSSPESVHRLLATAAGRKRFWAESAPELDGEILFTFTNGQKLVSRVLENTPPNRFALTYFSGSHVTIELQADGTGGTDLTLTEWNVPDEDRLENVAGWVSVLLSLKAAADFAVDLRNHDPGRGWYDGYVDV
ncbi:MAG: SRPBCC domain-containing protein [Bryobacteraceae bacterium]|nr:SRPBCC domain-containing protein [Bryobacteraceae bacterium]